MKWSFRRRPGTVPQQEASPVPPGSPLAEEDLAVVASLARRFLPEDVRDRWLALARPAIQLVPTPAASGWVARLGGLPQLPQLYAWPEWPGHGPLSYVGEIDCGQVQGFSLDMRLPAAGRLLFFYFDGSYDEYASTVGYWDRSSAPGAQAVFVQGADGGSEREAPTGVTVYEVARFVGRSVVTFPGWEHPDLRAEFMAPGEDLRAFMDHPVCDDAFLEALHERHTGPLHQIGGYANPVQGPVEAEIAQGVLGKVPWDSEAALTEAARWELLLQIDTDDSLSMMWGDCGMLYWLARPDDLAANDLSQINFTWQCS